MISDDEAKLIATTRLEGVPIDRIATLFGECANTVVQRRRRAEHRLAAALADGAVPQTPAGAIADRGSPAVSRGDRAAAPAEAPVPSGKRRHGVSGCRSV